jgi:N6-L-threonylcarbamoyladenine synthase
MRVLGIESSCDETGVAIFCQEKGLIADVLYSQIAAHLPYGGVVPEIASRDHIRQILPLIESALKDAKLSLEDMDAIAYTQGPGLVGALLVGASCAKSLAYAIKRPAIGVHHLEAHLLAAKMAYPEITFPFLALLVSGGHTQIILAHGLGHYELIGETLDDAVGEAFDKTAKVMGLSYPGGKALAELASHAAFTQLGMKDFPKPLLDRPGFDFSFSGLKTHALQAFEKSSQDQRSKEAIAYAFQTAVVDTLFEKIKRALLHTTAKNLVVAGGVAANLSLRDKLNTLKEVAVYFPDLKYCTDNGAMIAYTGMQYLEQNRLDANWVIDVKARWPLAQYRLKT